MTTETTQPTGDAPVVIVFPVDDLTAAKTLFTALLGAPPYADSPYYVGYRTPTVEIGLDPNGRRSGTTAPIAYWETDDIAGRIEALVAAGATVLRPASDVGAGMLVAVLAAADGTLVGLRQP